MELLVLTMRQAPTHLRFVRILTTLLTVWIGAHARADLPAATWDRLPPWRGFNLQNKFNLEWSLHPFAEADFQFIGSHGFNFVRLPVDYRVYTVGTNWTRFNQSALADFDRAIAWANTNGIHVCLNLHRIPGYTVASPAESTSLWTDASAQAAAAAHWAMWARRYRGIPNTRLSFNLLNEPAGITAAVYSNVVARLCAAIRAEDPDRLIIADGLDHGRTPVPELIPLRVAQATRGYAPLGLTHYRASWVDGSNGWPEPEWPSPLVNQYLYGPDKPDLRSFLRISGQFTEPATLRVLVGQVSVRSRLSVLANGRTIGTQTFVPGPGAGDWKEVVFLPQYGIYQNRYERSYSFTVPAGTTNISIQNIEGDWMTFREIGLRPASWPTNQEAVLRAVDSEWGRRQTNPVTFSPLQPVPFSAATAQDRAWLWRETIQPWIDLRARGVGILVGEWGTHQQTPHDVTLAWMRSVLENHQLADLGWALWNLEGSFGPIGSGRSDVAYEAYQGRPLDRAMFDLLREFNGQRESYAGWRDRVFSGRTESAAERAPRAALHPDGVANYLRYASGLTLDEGAGTSVFTVVTNQGQPELRFRRSLREVASRFQIEASQNLSQWAPLPEAPALRHLVADGVEWLSRPLPASDEARFFRLTVLPPDPGGP
jgi:aryl-phospho-beta-D-glucosidase BglC (GH1 family)